MFNPSVLHTILADDSVWPHVGFPARPTLAQATELVSKVTELYFLDTNGFVAMVKHEDDPTTADVHSGFTPAVRGQRALRFCKDVVAKCSFRRLETWCAPEHKAARVFAKCVGFRDEGEKMVLIKE